MKKKLLLLISFMGIGLTSLVQASQSHPSLSRLQGGYYVGEHEQDVALGVAGTLDPSLRGVGTGKLLPTLTTQYEELQATVVQDDGKIVVAGSSTWDGSKLQPILMRFLPNGQLDSSFNQTGIIKEAHAVFVNGDASLYAVAVQSDGKIVVAGHYKNVSLLDRPFVARYTATGALDTTFDQSGSTPGIKTLDFGSTGNNEQIQGLVVQPDGKILLVGTLWTTTTSAILARLDANGSNLDGAFNSGQGYQTLQIATSSTYGYDLALQPDGRIVITGYVATNGNDAYVARFTADGFIDTTWNDPTGYTTVDISGASSDDRMFSIAVANNGTIVTAGYSGDTAAVLRFDETGLLDLGFGTDGKKVLTITGITYSRISDLVLQKDGNIVVAGTADNSDILVARLKNGDGSLDATFNTTGHVKTDVSGFGSADSVLGVALQDDGKVVIVGRSDSSLVAARYLSSGQLDTTFVDRASLSLAAQLAASKASAMAVQDDGKVVVALDNGTNTQIHRYLPSGAVDADFTAVTLTGKKDVQNMIIDSFGRILVCGGNNDIPAADSGWVYAIPSSGGSSTLFSALTGFSACNALAQLSTGAIVVGGGDNTGQAKFAVFSYDGSSVDTSYASGGAFISGVSAVFDLLVDSADNLFIAYSNSGATVSKYSASGLDGGTFTFGTKLLASDASEIRMAFDSSGDILVSASQSDGTIKLRSYNSSTGANVMAEKILAEGSDTLHLASLRVTDDGNIFVVGYNATTVQQFAARLDSNGALDTSFGNSGFTKIQVPVNPTAAQALASGFAPDGRLYVAGYQTESATNVPYVTRVFNEQYVSEIARFPEIATTGSFLTTFGSTDGVSGILRPYHGVYGAALNQIPDKIIELASGKFLIAMHGKADDDADTRLHLVRLNADGSFDDTFDADGKLLLAQTAGVTDEYVSEIIEDKDNNILLASYATDKAILHKVNASGTLVSGWPVIISGTGNQALDVGIQSSQRILLFTKVGSNGRIYAYGANGSLDTTFNGGGSVDGQLSTGEHGIANMGPVYGAVVDPDDDIVIAYRNTSTGNVDIARITSEGEGLAAGFGTNGVVANVILSVSADDQIRVALDKDGNIVVAATTASNFVITHINRDTGAVIGSPVSVAMTTPQLKDLITIKSNDDSDSYALVVGYADQADDDMVLIRLKYVAGSLALDTDFNPHGATPGVLTKQFGDSVANYAARVATSAAIKSSTGDIIFTGYESSVSGQVEPVVTAILGTASTSQVRQMPDEQMLAGTLDTTFDDDGIFDLSALTGISTGEAKQIYAYRGSQASNGKMLVAIEEASTVKLVRLHADETLDTSFNATGIVDVSGTQVTSLIVDTDEKIIIAGNGAGTPWMKRYTSAGALDKTFDLAAASITKVQVVAEQTAGRYIVAGQNSGPKAVIAAFKDRGTGDLKVDTTFNPNGSNPGQYEIADADTNTLYALAVNSDDSIVTGYRNQSSSSSFVKLQENGTVDSTFSLGFSSPVKNAQEFKLAINSAGQIIVAVMRSTSAGIKAQKFSASGGFIAGGFTNNFLGSADVLTDMIVTADDKVILMGYHTGGSRKLWMMRLNATVTSGSLDTTFNASPTGSDVAGTITFDGGEILNAGSIFINGRILVAGKTGTNPMVGRLYGDNYVVETEQHPTEGSAGSLDTTLGTNGLLNFDAALTGIDLDAATASAMHMYADGSMLVGFNKGTSTIVVKLKADRTLDTSFNSTAGYVTIANATNLRNIFVADHTNDNGDIYLTGEHSSALWAKRISSAGVLDGSFDVTDAQSMQVASVIRKQNFGRVLVAGYDGTNGALVAYTNTGAVDTSFAGGAGKITRGTTGIYAMELDSYNRAYIAYKDGSTIKIERIYNQGTAVDSNFAPTAISQTTALSADQIRLVLDETNSRLYVAVQDGTAANNVIKVYGYNTATGASIGNDSVTLSGKVLELADVFMDTDQKLYAVGRTTEPYPFVARLDTSSGTTVAMDSNFGSSGIAYNNSATTLTVVKAGSLHPDRRIMVVGKNALDPQMMRFYGDEYVLEPTGGKALAEDGTLDTSFDVGNGGVVLSGGTGFTAHQIELAENQKVLVALGNGTNLKVAKYSADMQLDTSFGTASSGITATVAMATIRSMKVDGQGRILVAGVDAGVEKVVRFAADGNTVETFVATPALVTATKVSEQKSGRILVAGKETTNGVIVAYQAGGDALDTTFGPQGTDSKFDIGVAAQIDDFVIDSNDDIIFVYRQPSGNLQLAKLEENGSVLEWGPVDTGITPHTTNGTARVAINAAGNILVAVANNIASGELAVRMYDADGANPSTIAKSTIAVEARGIAAASDNSFVVCGQSPLDTNTVVFKYTSTGAADSAFNGQNGISIFSADSISEAQDVTILDDGRILVAGGDGGTNTIVVRVHNTPYVTEVAQMPGEAAVGTLDTTLADGAGALNLDTYLFTTNLDGFTVKRVYEYGNGSMLFALDNGTNSKLLRLNKDLTVDTFGTSGVVDIAGVTGVTGLHIDESNNIFVAGGSTTTWVRAYDDTGTALAGFSVTDNLDAGASEIAEQTMQRVLLAGAHSTSGVIRAYTTTGAVDSTFADDGTYETGNAAAIADISIDVNDKIVLVYGASGSVVMKRLSSNGCNEDATFTAGTALAVTGSKVRVIHDLNGKIVVATADGSNFRLRRYDTSGSNDGGEVNFAITGTANLANIYATADGKVMLLGYTSGNKVVAARTKADFTGLDTTFNAAGATPGVFEGAAGSLTTVYDGILHADRRIMLVGGSGTDPFMARLFGDTYTTVTKQAPDAGAIGSLDTTLGTNGVFDLSGLVGLTIPRALRTLSDGAILLAVENSSNQDTSVVKLDCDGVADTAFDSDGIAALTGLDNVRDLQIDQAGKILVTGGNGTNTWVRRLNATTGAVEDTFVNAVMKTRVGLVEQTHGRVIVAGSNSSDQGLVAAWKPDGSALDLTFGSGDGYFDDTTNITQPITSLVADSKDRLYVGFASAAVSPRARVARIAAHGSGLDKDVDSYSGFGATGFIADAFAENIAGDVQVALLNNDKIIVAAANAEQTAFLIRSYNADGTADVATKTISSIGSSVVLQDIVVTNENKVILLGDNAADHLVIQLTTALVPDADFGSSGIATLPDDVVTQLHAGVVTAEGRVLVAGQDATPNPKLMRVYADRFVGEDNQMPAEGAVGSFDISLNEDGGVDLSTRVATALDGFAGRFVHAYSNGNLLLAVDNGSNSKLTRVDADGFVDTTFGTSGFSTTIPTGVKHVAFDHAGKLLVACISRIQRYAADGTGSPKVFATLTSMGNIAQVAEQTSGRVLVAGYDSNVSQGAIAAYKSDEGTAEDGTSDTTFGLATQTDRYVTGVNANVDSFVVNADDTIVFAHKNGNNFELRKLNADGSALDTTFGGGDGIAVITGTAQATGVIKMMKDSSSKYLAAAVTDTNKITVTRIPANGGAAEFTTATTLVTGPVVSGLVETATGQIIVTGHDSSNNAFALRLTPAGAVDTTFNTDTGVLIGAPEAITAMSHSTVTPDGKIVLLGENASSNPVLHRMLADRYVANANVAQFPVVADAGTVDTTFGTNGVENVTSTLVAGQLKHIRLLTDATNNGKIITVVATGTNTHIARLKKDRTVDSGFTNGLIGENGVKALDVDNDNKLLLAGDNGTSSWLVRRGVDGAVDASFNADGSALTLTGMRNATAVAEQSSGRMIVAGQTGTTGTPQLIAVDVNGQLDGSFGAGTKKYEISGQATRISDIAIDENDRIIAVYKNAGGQAAVVAIRPNGISLDTSFGTNGEIASLNLLSGLISTVTNEVKIIRDNNGKIVVVAPTSAGISIVRYTADGTVDATALSQVVGGTPHIGSVHITDDNKIVIAAYDDDTTNKLVLLRVVENTGALTLDPDFNGGSALSVDLTAQNIQVVHDAITYQDRRILVAGSNGSTIPLLARVYGDEYTDMVDASAAKGALGSADSSMDGGDGAANLQVNIPAVTTAMEGVMMRVRTSDSAIFAAMKDGTNSYIVPVDGNGFLGTHFGGSVVTIAKPDLAAIEFDQTGKLLMVGQDASNEVWARRYTAAGAEETAFSNAVGFNNPVAIAEQSHGRIVAAGSNNAGSAGLVVGWKSDGTVDSSFGGGDSVFSHASVKAIETMALDNKDRIVIGFFTASGNAAVARVRSSGFWLDEAFNAAGASAGLIDTAITSVLSTGDHTIRLAIDSQNRTVVAAATSTGIAVRRFLENGTADTSFNSGGSAYTISTSTGITVRDVLITSNSDQITIVGHNGTDSLYVVELDDDGVRSAFNSGAIAQIQVDSNDFVKDAALYTDGRVMMLADNGTDPYLMRVHADRYVTEHSSLPATGVDFTLDTTFDPNDTTPDGGLNQETALGAQSPLKAVALRSATSTMYVATQTSVAGGSILARMDYDGVLDTTYNSTGLATTGNPAGVNHVAVDSSNRALMAGTNSGAAWVTRHNEDGSALTTFTAASGVTAGYAVSEQTNGRVILAGATSTDGVLVGYTPSGSVDATFGDSGIFTDATAAAIKSMVIDDADRIVFTYVDSGNVKVARVRSEGDSLDTRFGTSGVVTAFAGIDDTNTTPKVALDNNGKIIVAAVFDDASTKKLNICRYDNDGTVDAGFNSNAILVVNPLMTSPFITDLLVTADNRILVIGYNTGMGKAFIVRVNADGTFDTTFADRAEGLTAAFQGTMLPDGRVILVGKDGSGAPIMLRVYSERYLSEYRQAPLAGTVGTLDAALDLDADLDEAHRFDLGQLDASLAAVQPKRLLVDADGSSVIAVQKNATTTSLIRLDGDGQLDTSFNSGGAVPGVLDVSSAEGVNGLSFDDLGRIVVAGTDGTDSWAARYEKTDGTAVGTFVQAPNMTEIINILEQSTGRVILGGADNNGKGLLVGYAPISYSSGTQTNSAILDVTFAQAGRFTDANVEEINSFAIDSNDHVVVAYVNGSNAVELARVRGNGRELDQTFGTAGRITGVIASAATGRPAQVEIDATGRIIVAAATTTGISVRRYNAAGSTEDVGYNITLAAAGMTAPVVTRILTTTDHKIIVLGYDDAADDKMFALRLDNAGALDTTFNPDAGLLLYEVDAGQSVRQLADAYIHPDGRIVAVGHEGALS